MKLPKSLLQTIATAISLSAVYACADDSILSPASEEYILQPQNNFDLNPVINNTPTSKEVVPPDYYYCPPCGMG